MLVSASHMSARMLAELANCSEGFLGNGIFNRYFLPLLLDANISDLSHRDGPEWHAVSGNYNQTTRVALIVHN